MANNFNAHNFQKAGLNNGKKIENSTRKQEDRSEMRINVLLTMRNFVTNVRSESNKSIFSQE